MDVRQLQKQLNHSCDVQKHGRHKSVQLSSESQALVKRNQQNIVMQTEMSSQSVQGDMLPIGTLTQEIFKGMKKRIGGYFYKRRNVNQPSRFNGFLKSYLGINYDKRYFELDVHRLTIRYAKDDSNINGENAYVEQIRNIKNVRINTVSMPVIDKDGKSKMVPTNIYDQNARVDRGPSDCGGINHAFEIETIDRILTLYTQDGDQLQKFAYYLQLMLQIKNECLEKQQRQDQEMRSIQMKFTRNQGKMLSTFTESGRNHDRNLKLQHSKKDSLVTSINMLYSQPLSPTPIFKDIEQ